MSDIAEFITLITGETVPVSYLDFATSRSGGPGGQNVNKVETRVEVRFSVDRAEFLTERTRDRLREKLAPKLDSEGTLRVVSSSARTQRGNRIAAVERLEAVLNGALYREKPRKPTRPSYGSKLRRLESKKKTGEKKSGRRWHPGKD